MFVAFLKTLQPVRGLPIWARYALTTVVVLACFGIRYALEGWGRSSSYPFLAFFPGILFSAFAFNRGSGFYATILSGLLALYFFIEPRGSLIPYHTGDLVALVGFVTVGLLMAGLIEALRTTVDEAAEREEQLRLVIDGARDYAIFTTDPAGRVTSWPVGARAAFGYAPAEIVGRHFAVLFTPDDREAGVPAQELATARAQGHAPDQRWHIRKSGERFWVDGSTWPLRHPNGEEIGFLKIGRDDTVRRKAELLLQEAAERQEMITREVGHRVKNNLAIVTSLLSLQARNTANEETRAALSDARTRIEAIAQVHDQLWRQDQAETIDLDAFLRDLCAKVQEAVPHHRIDYEGEPVTVGIDRAVSISLLVNELITNAVKYAYPDTEGGPIRVSLRPAGADCLRLEVSDRGRGMPENIVTGASEGSFGTKLLRTFARQLDASLDIDSHAHGTRLTLIIPVRPGVSCQA